jgi:ABC-type multidrug transport system permease subunit
LCLSSLGAVNTVSSIQPFVEDKPAFSRERFTRLFRVSSYVVATTLAELPMIIFSAVAFVVIVHFACGFTRTTEALCYFIAVFSLWCLLCTYLGQLFASAMPTFQLATVCSSIVHTLFSLFGGMLISPGNIPVYWQFMFWLDPMRYALEALTQTQFHGINTLIALVDGEQVITSINQAINQSTRFTIQLILF